MKNTVTVLLTIIGIASVSAQQPPPPDISMLTNHASLVSYAFKQIKGIKVALSSGSQAMTGDYGGFIPFTNEVKSLQGLVDTVQPWWFGIPIVDTKDYISVSVNLWNTNDINAVYSGDTKVYTLFYGYGGGQPIKSPYGYWTLPTDNTDLQLHIASTIKIKVKGLVAARLIVRDQWGNPYGIPVNSSYSDGEMDFPSDFAGMGELVLTTQYQDTNGNWYADWTGYSLTNTTPMAVTWVDFGILLQGSDDFVAFKNPSIMDVSVYSYMDYGKVPLLMSRFDKDLTRGVTLSVHTIDGQYATSYIIENQQTKIKVTIDVPAGSNSAKFDFIGGDYNIIPLGINLVSPTYFNGGGGYGKGAVPVAISD